MKHLLFLFLFCCSAFAQTSAPPAVPAAKPDYIPHMADDIVIEGEHCKKTDDITQMCQFELRQMVRDSLDGQARRQCTYALKRVEAPINQLKKLPAGDINACNSGYSLAQQFQAEIQRRDSSLPVKAADGLHDARIEYMEQVLDLNDQLEKKAHPSKH